MTASEPPFPSVIPRPPLAAPERALVRRVEHAVAELRRGGAVAVASLDAAPPETAELILAIATETHGEEGQALLHSKAPQALRVVSSRQRAAALGLCDAGPGAVVLVPAPGSGPESDPVALLLNALEKPGTPCDLSQAFATVAADSAAAAVVALAKLGGLVPAALFVPIPGGDEAWARSRRYPFVSAAAVAAYPQLAARNLQPVAEARVPLTDAPNTRIIAFRPGSGGQEHLAIIVGAPARDAPVLIRVHSACFTGDLLGSLRCDCGDQLRRAIAELARQGGGVVLYLAQEGRGIGLVNKLRAYALQDQGLDTYDANLTLGFESDERLYLPAAEILLRLGITRVRVMTNNPDKLEQLAAGGVDVVERVPHIIPSNQHNDAYLQAKAQRAGHMF